MSNFTQNIIETLVAGGDLKELFRQELESAINKLLETELTSFLGYERYSKTGYHSGDSRNGSYSRQLDTEYGALQINIPRDRNGEFEQQTIGPYVRRENNLETTIIQLYSHGISNSEIADLIEKMYGHYYSKMTISNLTSVITEQVDAFKTRSLASRYAVVYLDATYLPMRRDTVQKEAVHIAIGITPEGHKEILGYQIAPQESSVIYQELLESLKANGLEAVLLFVGDGFSHLPEIIGNVYPKAKFQQCLVHVARNLMSHVRKNDRQQVLADFKKIRQAENIEAQQVKLVAFKDEWQQRYSKLIKGILENSYLWTYMSFPKEIQRSIYSTNLIESFNKQLKKQLAHKEQFPNEDALERFLVDLFIQYNDKFLTRHHNGFLDCQYELEQMF